MQLCSCFFNDSPAILNQATTYLTERGYFGSAKKIRKKRAFGKKRTQEFKEYLENGIRRFWRFLFGKDQKAIDDMICKSIRYLIDEGYKKTDILLCLSWIIAEIASKSNLIPPNLRRTV